ncbi:MAG: NapC/NirT family cytochrome c [Anaerolineae bacterium]|nr:NapC/NirT family cytochrome c [Anaerolineae bacterium]
MVWLRNRLFGHKEHITLRDLLPFGIAAFGIIVVLLAIPPIWEYSNSPGFCGTTCHTMPPEFSTYLVSPHSRVLCVDCHIGRDLILVQAFRKAGHMRLVVDTILQNYEYPIRSAEMRPASETCELCHTPEKFSDDSLRVIETFENNRANDPYSIYLLMHTGGGSQREGLGRGIHWHIENKITYVALDPEEQEIPWVRVETPDGQVTEFVSVNSPVDATNIDQYEQHEIDCITCHNRISHLLQNPSKTVDEALAAGDVSRDIPFIRARMVELLTTRYASTEDADRAFETLDQYYRDYYADFYATGAEQVATAIEAIKTLYRDNNYPEQLLYWNTHPDNIGHRDAAGCFRCHDGQHFSSEGEVIRLECNLCHSIPKVVRPDEIEPKLSLATGIEPASHLTSTWIAQHRTVFDASCSNCHTISNPGGISDQSFCSNSVCHGVEWRYAGFNAPGLATILGIYQVEPVPLLEDFNGDPTYTILQPLFAQECGACHGPVPSKGLRLTDYASLLAGSESGPIILPGSPEESVMIDVLTSGHFAQLTDHQLDLLTRWVASGAPQ